MLRALGLAAAAAFLNLVMLGNVHALPISAAPSADGAAGVTLVAGGCGYGYHRGPYGHCRPNVGPGPVVVVPPPVVVAPRPVVVLPRVCPRGFHLGPEGRRCWPNR